MAADFELIIKLKDHLQDEFSYDLSHLTKQRDNLCHLYGTMDHVLHSIARFLVPDSEFAKDMSFSIEDLQLSKTRMSGTSFTTGPILPVGL